MTVFKVTKTKGSDVSARASYFESEQQDQAGCDDYYLKQGSDTMSARFVGSALGVAGVSLGQTPAPGDYIKLFNGKRIDNDEYFISDEKRRDLENERTNRVHGYSTAFSVDKSISIFYAGADKETQALILKSLSDAASDVVSYAEDTGKFVARLGKGGNAGNVDVKVMGAIYTHVTSRSVDGAPPDPQLHVHLEIANFCKGEDGIIRALDAGSSLYRRQKEYSGLFDTAFYQRLENAGIDTHTFENDFGGRGLISNAVTDKQRAQFSKRRHQIVESLNESGHSTALAKNIAALNTRSVKTEVLDFEALHGYWKETIGEINYEIRADRNPPTKLMLEDVLFKGKSVTTEIELDRTAALLAPTNTYGLAGIEAIKAEIVRELDVMYCSDKNLITTKDFVKMESELVRYAIRQKENKTHNINFNEIREGIDQFQERKTDEMKKEGKESAFILNEEQAKAVYHIAETSGFSIMQGAAGTGKSATFGAVRDIYKNQGYNVIGIAPSGKAAEGLIRDGINSMTLHRFLLQYENEKISVNDKTLILLDEAGMTDTRSLHAIAYVAEKHGAKFVAAQDSKQLESVGSASTSSMLADDNVAGNTELIRIARQNHLEDRDIAQSWLKGAPGEAWRKAKARGQIIGVGELTKAPDDEDGSEYAANASELNGMARIEEGSAVATCALAYLEDLRAEERAGGPGGQTLMLADTRADVRTLNNIVRAARIEAGEVRDDAAMYFDFDGDGNGFREERIAPGDRVMFRKGDGHLGVVNGTTGRVVNRETQTIKDKQQEVLNVQLDGSDRSISVSTGYTGLQVAYATTVHKSQGMTVNKAHQLLSDLTDRRAAYVGGTRARENTQMYLDVNSSARIAQNTSQFSSKTCALKALENGVAAVVGQEREAISRHHENEVQISTVIAKALSKPKTGVVEQIERSGPRCNLAGLLAARDLGDDRQRKSTQGMEADKKGLLEIFTSNETKEDLRNKAKDQPDQGIEAG